MIIPIIWLMSLIKTPVAAKNKLTPNVKKINGAITTGIKIMVGGGNPINTMWIMHHIDKLTRALKRADPIVTIGRISSGKITLLT